VKSKYFVSELEPRTDILWQRFQVYLYRTKEGTKNPRRRIQPPSRYSDLKKLASVLHVAMTEVEKNRRQRRSVNYYATLELPVWASTRGPPKYDCF
jgi:hypothetical protein